MPASTIRFLNNDVITYEIFYKLIVAILTPLELHRVQCVAKKDL